MADEGLIEKIKLYVEEKPNIGVALIDGIQIDGPRETLKWFLFNPIGSVLSDITIHALAFSSAMYESVVFEQAPNMPAIIAGAEVFELFTDGITSVIEQHASPGVQSVWNAVNSTINMGQFGFGIYYLAQSFKGDIPWAVVYSGKLISSAFTGAPIEPFVPTGRSGITELLFGVALIKASWRSDYRKKKSEGEPELEQPVPIRAKIKRYRAPVEEIPESFYVATERPSKWVTHYMTTPEETAADLAKAMIASKDEKYYEGIVKKIVKNGFDGGGPVDTYTRFDPDIQIKLYGLLEELIEQDKSKFPEHVSVEEAFEITPPKGYES